MSPYLGPFVLAVVSASRWPPQNVIRYQAYAMRKFRVRLRGCNFLVADGDCKRGFFSNRFVEADDEKTAELAAVDQLRNRQSLRDVVRNAPNDPPSIHLDELVELASFDSVKSLDQGLVWYPEDPAVRPA